MQGGLPDILALVPVIGTFKALERVLARGWLDTLMPTFPLPAVKTDGKIGED
jgi:hypothetical protein